MSHMRQRRFLGLATVASALALAGTTAGAFGAAGHRIIGRIAELHLQDSRALKEVRRILTPEGSLAEATVWPDTIKNPLYEDEDTGPFRLEHPAHDTYHYANLPFQADGYQLSVPGARAMDIVQTMRESISVLRGQSTLFTERQALRYLAHLAGDVHQPLHVGNAFVGARGPLAFVVPEGPTGWRTTLGGNALLYGPADRFNLHAFWDSHAVNISMGSHDVPTYAGRLFRDVAVVPGWQSAGDASSWPAQWANDSLRLAKELHEGLALVQYLGPDDAKRTAHRWRIQQPDGYEDLARARIPTQLAKGGYRLAMILKAIWPDRP